MGPMTYLVTAVVTGGKDTSIMHTITTTWREKGLIGFYPGGSAIAFRQATNWASRQGFTDAVRSRMATLLRKHPPDRTPHRTRTSHAAHTTARAPLSQNISRSAHAPNL